MDKEAYQTKKMLGISDVFTFTAWSPDPKKRVSASGESPWNVHLCQCPLETH